MEIADIEGEVGVIYAEAGVDPRYPIGAVDLAHLILGEDGVYYVDQRALRGDACFGRLGTPRIFVRRKLPLERLQFAVAHELGERRLRQLDYRPVGPLREQVANAMAAAILAPRRAYQIAIGVDGAAFGSLADRFQLTQTCAALRWGEVTDRPIAVVAPSKVRVRGEAWGWPSTERAIRRLRVDALTRVDLTDARKRWALLAA